MEGLASDRITASTYVALAVMWSICVWPGCYRVEKAKVHETELLYKVNRLTGDATLIANPAVDVARD